MCVFVSNVEHVREKKETETFAFLTLWNKSLYSTADYWHHSEICFLAAKKSINPLRNPGLTEAMEQLYEQGTNILKDHSMVVHILAHSLKRYTIFLNHPVRVSVFS